MPDAREAGALLTLAQWLWPSFPTGAFAYSHGLEWAIAVGDVRDAAGLRDWLAALLRHGSGRSDAILLANALRPDGDLAMLADLGTALAAGSERELETVEQGVAFLETTRALTGRSHPPMPYPVALGAAARPLGLPPRTVVALYLHAFVGNLVAAGVRFVPLGQTEGQRVLADLQPLLVETVAEAVAEPPEAIGTAAFRSDLAAMHHETLSPRMLRT
ncbi:MAG TPA: urease accessory UreF family protein [Amaricoccus sp.]|nr:urease accessory UreF family protein [Amaricoccus sp.]